MTSGQSTTSAGVLQSIGIDVTDGNKAIIEVKGARPDQITSHIVEEEFYIMGMSPSDFINEHGGDTFDFPKMVTHFKGICKDFEESLVMTKKSRAVQFCSLMIYKVGPASRQVKQKMNDKTWVFRFPYLENGVPVVKVAYVSTYKNDNSTYSQDNSDGNKIVLSIKHASLLAVMTLARITDLATNMPSPVYILTPLCGAIFSRIDLQEISKILKCGMADAIKILNASCQSGGHYLDDSTVHVAALAAVVGTQKLGAKGKNDERSQIILKVVKQYLQQGKQFDTDAYVELAQFATGGVPAGLEPSSLIKLFTEAKKSRSNKMNIVKAIKAAAETDVNVKSKNLIVDTPPVGSREEFLSSIGSVDTSKIFGSTISLGGSPGTFEDQTQEAIERSRKEEEEREEKEKQEAIQKVNEFLAMEKFRSLGLPECNPNVKVKKDNKLLYGYMVSVTDGRITNEVFAKPNAIALIGHASRSLYYYTCAELAGAYMCYLTEKLENVTDDTLKMVAQTEKYHGTVESIAKLFYPNYQGFRNETGQPSKKAEKRSQR